ncbi:conserved hypothetical protein [Burkholderia sp. 8Y]|uniref:hypothetical protein n=1 Tax=Burkholderia sp. 8Y TaxID=2653133 RepID=UPI0012F28E68|nr:hypothetical protein [Burkholderia sp. 8Y]VXC94539.1 conserved hypothetical protein [Burkholderia sp. 8Y]
MQPTLSTYRIDPTPRRADGEYIAHARISANNADGSETDIFMSGDLAGFDLRDDAVTFAMQWAQEWLAARFGHSTDEAPVAGARRAMTDERQEAR